MKAITIDGFGGIEKLKTSVLPDPVPASDEVIINVRYAGVNPVDWKIREGYLKERLPHKFPLIPGWDAAGVIAAVGKDVEKFKVGDEVFAYCRKPEVQWGTYAESVALGAEFVAHKPKNTSFAEAAAIPLVGLTAWQALFDAANLQKGQTVLVHAGAGGVGSLAIQFAKHIGARVMTTASVAKHDYVKKLGADVAIDYAYGFVEQVLKAAPEGVDLVFDCVGGKTLDESMPVVKRGGHIISIVQKPDEQLAEKYGIHPGYVFVRPNGEQLAEIGRLIETGKVVVPKIEELSIKDVAKAQEQSRNGRTLGKMVLKVDF